MICPFLQNQFIQRKKTKISGIKVQLPTKRTLCKNACELQIVLECISFPNRIEKFDNDSVLNRMCTILQVINLHVRETWFYNASLSEVICMQLVQFESFVSNQRKLMFSEQGICVASELVTLLQFDFRYDAGWNILSCVNDIECECNLHLPIQRLIVQQLWVNKLLTERTDFFIEVYSYFQLEISNIQNIKRSKYAHCVEEILYYAEKILPWLFISSSTSQTSLKINDIRKKLIQKLGQIVDQLLKDCRKNRQIYTHAKVFLICNKIQNLSWNVQQKIQRYSSFSIYRSFNTHKIQLTSCSDSEKKNSHENMLLDEPLIPEVVDKEIEATYDLGHIALNRELAILEPEWTFNMQECHTLSPELTQSKRKSHKYTRKNTTPRNRQSNVFMETCRRLF